MANYEEILMDTRERLARVETQIQTIGTNQEKIQESLDTIILSVNRYSTITKVIAAGIGIAFRPIPVFDGRAGFLLA